MESLAGIESYLSILYEHLILPFYTSESSDPQTTPLATKYAPRKLSTDLTFTQVPDKKENGTTAETIIYNSWHEKLRDEVIPRATRRYGLRPRGVTLRFRDPPAWTKHPQAAAILKEMHYQGLFNKTIDRAYRVHPMVAMIQEKYGEFNLLRNDMMAIISKRLKYALNIASQRIVLMTREAMRDTGVDNLENLLVCLLLAHYYFFFLALSRFFMEVLDFVLNIKTAYAYLSREAA